MFLLATAAAFATATPAPQPVRSSAQARATIRIISGETVSFSRVMPTSNGRPFRDTIVRGATGGPQPAKVIEFE
jgi:hypothetical protein